MKRTALAPSLRTLLVVLGLASSACFRTKADIQRDAARGLAPAEVQGEPGPGPAPEVTRRFRTRVLVGADYAAETVHAEERVRRQIARANRVLARQFGVELNVVEVRPWSRDVRERSLEEAMEDLARQEPGDGVTWVIGFVGSTGQVSRTAHQLGMARMLGRHLVLRKMTSLEEREAFDEAFDALSGKERETLLRERTLHREAAVFLHEWAHTLGAPHELAEDSLLSARYSHRQSAFSAGVARILELGLALLEDRDDPGRLRTWALGYREEADRGRGLYDDASVVEMRAFADELLARAPEPAPPPRPAPAEPGRGAGGGRVAAARLDLSGVRAGPPGEALAKAETNLRLGDAGYAWSLAAPVAATHGRHAWVQAYACGVGRQAAPRDPAVKEACRRGAAVSRSAGAAAFALVRALVELGDRAAAARAALQESEALARGAPRKATAGLASLLADLGLCTRAERLSARARGEGDASSADRACRQTRALTMLGPGKVSVPEAREHEYVELFRTGRAAGDAGRAEEARAAARDLEASFPGLPAVPFLRCLASASSGPAERLRTDCEAAERAAPWAYEPPYVLGMLAGSEGRWSEARVHLGRALEREPRDPDLWARLGHATGKAGDAAGLADLERRFRERFGTALATRW